MELEPFYSAHVKTMTRKQLNEKSDIAAELAFRDMRIKEAEEFISQIPLRTEDPHVLHYVEMARSWLNRES